MRWRLLGITFAAMLSLGLTGAAPAGATDLHRTAAPEGWGKERVVKHHMYYPRYRHVYLVHDTSDPYAYRPATRGYYPYYNSGYWHPASGRERPRYVLPKYYPAWGYTKHWHNREWHAENHGRHWPWHW